MISLLRLTIFHQSDDLSFICYPSLWNATLSCLRVIFLLLLILSTKCWVFSICIFYLTIIIQILNFAVMTILAIHLTCYHMKILIVWIQSLVFQLCHELILYEFLFSFIFIWLVEGFMFESTDRLLVIWLLCRIAFNLLLMSFRLSF